MMSTISEMDVLLFMKRCTPIHGGLGPSFLGRRPFPAGARMAATFLIEMYFLSDRDVLLFVMSWTIICGSLGFLRLLF